MALKREPRGAGSSTSRWAARAILILGAGFVIAGLSLLILFGLNSPGLPAAIWGVLLIVVYGFFEPDTMRAFLGQGQLRAGTRALASVLLVVAAVVLINVFARDKLASAQLDLTKNHANSLAPQTTQIAQSISQPVTVTLWSSQSNSENQTAFDLLQRYRAINSKLVIQRYTVLERPLLAQQQKIQQAGSAVFETVGHPQEVTTDLTESGFDSVLVRLVTGRSPKVYFLTGHGEPAIGAASATGSSISSLSSALQKQGIKTSVLNLSAGGGGGTVAPAPAVAASPTPAPTDTGSPTPSDTGSPAPAPSDTSSPSPAPAPAPAASPPAVAAAAIPADADEVVVLDPQSNLSAPELAAINAYVDKGGRIMVSAGPFSKSNAGDLVKRFGLTFGTGIIIDQQLQVRNAQGGILQVTNYGQGVVSRGLSNLPTILLGATSVDGKAPAGYSLFPIVATQADACQRTDATNPSPNCGAGDRKGPFNILVTVEQTGAKAGSKPIRAVVIGGAAFASDVIALSQNRPPGNQPLMINAVNWLAGQDKVVNVPVNSNPNQNIFLTDAQKQLVLLGYPVLLPLLLLGLGVNAYLRRR